MLAMLCHHFNRITPIYRVFLGLFLSLIICFSTPLIFEQFHVLETIHSQFFWLSLASLAIILYLVIKYRCYLIFGILLCYFGLYLNYDHLAPSPAYKNCTLKVVPNGFSVSASRIRKTHYLTLIQGLCSQSKKQPSHQTIIKPQTLLLYEYNNRYNISSKQGQLLTFNADLSHIKSKLNTGIWDKKKHYWLININLQLSAIQSINQTTHINNQLLSNLRYQLTNTVISIRQWISQKIDSHLSNQFSGFLKAILIGSRTDISYDNQQLLQQTGTSHLLAISGMHVAMIGGLAWIVFQCLWALSYRLSSLISPIKIGALISFFTITTYAVLTGFNLPVQRAWIMFSLLIISWLFLKNSSENSLCWAAIIVLIIYPKSSLSISFYLSFIATYAVISIIRLPLNGFAKICLVQLTIYFSLLPIIWYQFSIIPLISVIANLIIIPWLSLIIFPLTLLCLAIPSHFSWLNYLWQILDFCLNALASTLNYLKDLNWIIYPNHNLYLWQAILSILIIFLILRISTRKLTHQLVVKPIKNKDTQNKYVKYWLLTLATLYLSILIPFKTNTSPTLILSDHKFSRVLAHNSQQAIIINPGYKNKRFNEAKSWVKYLKQHSIDLKIIVLQDDKISKIAATNYLLKQYPNAKIITLKSFDIPFMNQFCGTINLHKTLGVISQFKDNQCYAHLIWENISFELFNNNQNKNYVNAIDPRGGITINQSYFNSQKLGEIQLIQQSGKIELFHQRKIKRPWRTPLIEH